MENRAGYVRRRLCTVGVNPSTGGGSIAEHSRKQKVLKTAEMSFCSTYSHRQRKQTCSSEVACLKQGITLQRFSTLISSLCLEEVVRWLLCHSGPHVGHCWHLIWQRLCAKLMRSFRLFKRVSLLVLFLSAKLGFVTRLGGEKGHDTRPKCVTCHKFVFLYISDT